MKKTLLLLALALLSVITTAQGQAKPTTTIPSINWTGPDGVSDFCSSFHAACSTTICLGESVCFSYTDGNGNSSADGVYSLNHIPLTFSDGGSIMVENTHYTGPNATGCVNYTPSSTGLVTSSGVNNSTFSIYVLPSAPPILSANITPLNPCEGTQVCAQSLTSPIINFSFTSNTAIGCNNAVPCNTPNTIPFCFPAGVNYIKYTVNAGHTCSNVAVYSVNVTPPKLQIDASLPATCSGNYCFNVYSQTGCSLGSSLYQWTITDNSGNFNYQITTALPSLCTTLPPGTYTVFVDLGNSLFASYALTVPPLDPCVCYTCNPIGTAGTIPTSPTANQQYCITNNVSITGYVTFTDCEFKISPNVNVSVAPGAVLIINHSHLSAATNMWRGIVVQNGGRLLVLNNSLIEDALVGAEIYNNTSTSQILTVNASIFNKNQTDIFIHGYNQTYPATYPFSINNSLFTCRDISNCATFLGWPATSVVKAASNPVTSPLQTPYINNSAYPVSSLKAPYAGSKSFFGIRLQNVGFSSVSTTSAYYAQMLIGSSGGTNNYNLFDNHYIGIDIANSNVSVMNCIFQNGWDLAFPTLYSCGIKAVTNSSLNNRLLVSTASYNNNNKFYDLSRDVRTENYYDVSVNYCEMYSTRVFNPSVPTQAGAYGISGQTNHYNVINMNNNKIFNIDNGIDFKSTVGAFSVGTSSYNGQYIGSMYVNNNTIHSNVNTHNLSPYYGSKAITITGLIGGIKITKPNAQMEVNNNNIFDYINGISCSNWKSMGLSTKNNYVVIRGLANNGYQYGIEHSNNALYPALYFKQYGITDNNVANLGSISSKGYGIRSVQNTLYAVLCNTITGTYNGLAFSGYHPNDAFVRFNNMSANRYGFVLENSGRIGTMGSNSGADFADNQWLGAYNYPSYKTGVFNSNAQYSKMFVRNQPTFNPNGSGYTNGGPGSIYSVAAGNILTAPYEGTFYGCFLTKPAPVDPNISSLEGLLSPDADNFSVPAAGYVAKTQLYDYLTDNPSAQSPSAILSGFYKSNASQYRDVFSAAQSTAAEGDLNTAHDATSSFIAQNTIQEKHKMFYDMLFKFQAKGAGAVDEAGLLALARGCPYLEGTVIHQARALYNIIYDQNITFEDNCNFSLPGTRQANNNYAESTIIQSEDAFLYPNPSSGSEIYVSVSVKGLESAEVTIRSMNGVEMCKETVGLSNGIGKLSFDAPNGVYMVTITNVQNKQSIIKKLVIQK